MKEAEVEVEVESSGWGCPPSPPSPSKWPNFPSAQFPSEADLHYSSPDVQAWSVGNQMQLHVVNQVKHLFTLKDEEFDEDSEDDSDGSDSESDPDGDCSFFFSKLFEDNKELREFYVKNHQNGEFGCLVCGGVGFIKRFKDCVSLVQHTLSISNTKKKMRAHRGFGHVVCKLLAWDINKLPSLNQNNKITPQAHGGNDALRDVDVAEPKGKEEATGNDKFPTIHISDHAQEHCKEDGNGKNESEDNQ